MIIWEYVHETIGLHIWDIPAAAALLAAAVTGILHWRRQKRREKDHEEHLQEMEAAR